jgi:hypothetical protein
LFYHVNTQRIYEFDQISVKELVLIMENDQDIANRVAIPQALMIVKLHNVNATKESHLIKDFYPYLPYASRFELQQMLSEIPDVTVKAAKDFIANEPMLKKRVSRVFKQIKPALEHLSKK